MRRIILSTPTALLFLLASAPVDARAQSPMVAADRLDASPLWAAEINVLWPFIGISEMKCLIPVLGSGDTRGELLTGVYLDYAQIVRPNAGKAFILAGMLGFRQFFFEGLHAEVVVDFGVRHESHHPVDDATLNDLYARVWPMAGYQLDLAQRFYVNARGGAGLLVYRQTHWAEEKKIAIAGDLNLGFRF
jgi:hypothetical protein